MSEPEIVERTDPEEAFAALSSDARIEILRALWAADDHELSFSALRAAVGMSDSGQFNYHLDKLVGSFLSRTDDGYRLTQAGRRVNGAIEAGAYTAAASFDPIELPEPCPSCDGTRTLRYEDEIVRVECESCPMTNFFDVPPSVFQGADREDVPELAGRYLRVTFHRIDTGFCPFCHSPVEPTVAPIIDLVEHLAPDYEAWSEDADEFPAVQYDCKRCGATPIGSLPLIFLDHPAVAGFYYDRGIDVRERSVWEFTAMVPGRERIRSRDPFRASVTYRADGDAITLVVDESLDVVEIETER